MLREKLTDYHCPRWNELPEFPLYRDQAIMIITTALSPFAEEGEPLVTPAMINNYVKLKLVPSPEKKKYDRKQISALIIFSLFKRVFSMYETAHLMTCLVDMHGYEDAYNLFCEQLEAYLTMFSLQGQIRRVQTDDPAYRLMTDALSAVLSKTIVQESLEELSLLRGEGTLGEKPAKPKTPKEKTPKEKQAKKKAAKEKLPEI